MENISRKVATALLDIGAVKVRIDPPFTWVSGIKAPVYCDNRMMISHVEGRDLIVKAFKEKISRARLNKKGWKIVWCFKPHNLLLDEQV